MYQHHFWYNHFAIYSRPLKNGCVAIIADTQTSRNILGTKLFQREFRSGEAPCQWVRFVAIKSDCHFL